MTIGHDKGSAVDDLPEISCWSGSDNKILTDPLLVESEPSSQSQPIAESEPSSQPIEEEEQNNNNDDISSAPHIHNLPIEVSFSSSSFYVFIDYHLIIRARCSRCFSRNRAIGTWPKKWSPKQKTVEQCSILTITYYP